MQLRRISRREAFEGMVAVLVALTGAPAAGGGARNSGDASDGDWAFDGTVYRRFDEYGRVIMEFQPRARLQSWTTYYDYRKDE